jgi:hypothetical protein
MYNLGFMERKSTTTHTGTIGSRRQVLQALAGGTLWMAGGTASRAAVDPTGQVAGDQLPDYARELHYESLKQGTWDRTGGNADYRPIAPGATLNVFESTQPGAITHVWFTIAARSDNHLKELVLRAYWDGNSKPSVETPIGDFFGLTLGQYVNYDSAFLSCSPGKSLNSYFVMPYKKSARITVTNEGTQPVGSFYSNIDYQNRDIPADAHYFHAQYRQAAPCLETPAANQKTNLDGRYNYVFCETEGRGHLMGVSMGVLANKDGWFGEGDEMIFVDDRDKPAITGTGTEDYFLGSWDFGGRDNAVPFAYRYFGAPLITNAERTGARYCLYRWHADNPVTFRKYLRYTIEHGHANDRNDDFYSVAYWYQSDVYTNFPALPPAVDRIPRLHVRA